MLGLQRVQSARLPPPDTRRRMDTATGRRCRRKQCGRTRGRTGRRGLDRAARGPRQRYRFAAVHSRGAGRRGNSARPGRRGRTGTCRSRRCRRFGRTWSPTCGRSRHRLSGRSSGHRGAQHRRRRRCREGREARLSCFGLAQSCTGQQQGVSGGTHMNSASDQ